MSTITPADLVALIQELYRPSLRGHWQRRVQTRLRRWLDQPHLSLPWTTGEERADAAPVRLPLPGRDRPPRWLGLQPPVDARTRRLAELLLPHLSTVAELMEADPTAAEMPPRWRSSLTQRQGQVALLAAAGQTNEDISRALGIAPRTVARLLQETFRRLALSNRAALAAECALGRPPTPFHDTDARGGLCPDDADD